jgi:hypothetical protein
VPTPQPFELLSLLTMQARSDYRDLATLAMKKEYRLFGPAIGERVGPYEITGPSRGIIMERRGEIRVVVWQPRTRDGRRCAGGHQGDAVDRRDVYGTEQSTVAPDLAVPVRAVRRAVTRRW